MKRIIVVGVSTIVILIVAGILAYYYLFPGYAADLVLNEEIPSYIPQKYVEKIEEIKKPLAAYSDEIFKTSDSLNLSLDIILRVIDTTDPDEVLNVYYQLENKTVTDSEDVFNLIILNVTITEVDPSNFKSTFLKYATPGRINRLLRYVEQHELATTLGPNAAKKIAKQLAIKHYEKRKELIKEME
jgi:hypothetical protein